MKHTPGPWRADGQFIRAVDSNVAVVITNATMSGKMSPKDEADACLIAAAPELLAALKFYADEKNLQSSSSGFALQYDPEPSPIHKDGGSRARAAIAKAEGE